MLITAILITITFILTIVSIASNKIDRTVVALFGGVITFFLIYLLEGATFQMAFEIIFGNAEDDYANFHALVLILGMSIIVAVSIQAGLFQFLSFRVIQMTKGEPRLLLLAFGSLAFFISTVINDILTIILLLPLTITTCKTLNIDPIPY